MNSSVSIHFIRRADAKVAEDDKVTIIRTGVNEFGLTYTSAYTHADAGARASNYVSTVTMSDRGVFRWFRCLINIMEIDEEPFYRMQIDFPTMPSIIFDTRRIGRYYHSLLDALDYWLDESPAPATPCRMEPRTPPMAPGRPTLLPHDPPSPIHMQSLDSVDTAATLPH